MSSFDVAHGMSVWDYLQGELRLQGYFNDTMAANSKLLMDTVVTNCGEVARGIRLVVACGGGIGMAEGHSRGHDHDWVQLKNRRP